MQIPYLFDLNLKISTVSRVFAPGSSLTEKYKVEKVIASTHFSTVLSCFDLFERKKVCIKVIHNQKETFDQGLDEVKIMNLLQKHAKGGLAAKNIVKLLEFFYYRESLHIVYELLGENLFVLASNPHILHMFQGECLGKIIKQVLTALDFIHSQGIIHADIKPENILLSSPLTPRRSFNTFDVRLVDFGSSCYQTDSLTTYIQSKAYRAPEVIVGGKYDFKIDIWSLGCVIAELLTGEVLFEACSLKEMITKVKDI
jgi:serine/threonine protein kinase